MPKPGGPTGRGVRPGAAKTAAASSYRNQNRRQKGLSWGVLLLRSYASVITLACVWFWWQGRHPVGPAVVSTGAEVAYSGERGGWSQIVAPSGSIPADNFVPLGRSLRLGAIEFTPLAISKGVVELEQDSADGTRQVRDGGSNALRMRVRIKNLSPDRKFAPLDEGFVQPPKTGEAPSYLETENGTRIAMYPRPASWTIADQQFREIGPGEILDSVVVSEKNAVSYLAPHMTWRLRLRTSVDQTELIGVHFDKSQVR